MKKVIVAVIVIIISVISFLAGGWYGRDGSDGPGPQAEREVLYYVDPMTPGFRSDKPGIAPCGMPLEPVYADTGDEQVSAALGGVSMSPGAVKVSLARQQLIGVTVRPVEVKPMTYTLRLYGRIVSDETKIYRINASTDSWVRQLSDITTGSIVGRDQLLAEVLAPAFYNAQVTYLVAMDNLDRIRAQLGVEIRHQQTHLADNQIRMAVQNLQNLGITDAQIEELANTRQARPYLQVRSPADGVVLGRNITLYQWFKAGEEFYDIADIGRVWVYADVYEDEVRHIRPGMDVKVRHEQMGRTFDARVSQVLPLFDPVAKTLKVRLDVDNPRYDLRPDMFVDVEIPITLPPTLHVPAEAIIDSGTRTIVYVDAGNGFFEPREVETGWRLGRRVEITGGLISGEKVIISGNFLIDSESRMKTAAAGMQGRLSRDPVCGMTVDEEKAEFLGMTATYADEIYYFSMDQCKSEFEKQPQKYARKKQVENKKAARAVMPEMGRSWAEMLRSAKGSHVMKKSGTYPGQEMKRTIGTPSSSSGVVDWDGNAPPNEWPPGWGGFPGAKYLGIKRQTGKSPPQPSDGPKASGENMPEAERAESETAPTTDSHDSMMTHETKIPPAFDQARPAAK